MNLFQCGHGVPPPVPSLVMGLIEGLLIGSEAMGVPLGAGPTVTAAVATGAMVALPVGAAEAVGFTLAIILLASIRTRIREEDIPPPLRGAPIVLISAALMSIAFMGFGGLSF